jgi:cell division protein FtsB
MAAAKEQKELSVDEHNAKVSAEVAELEAQIAKLKKTYKSESARKQVDLHDCLTKFPR